MVTTTEKINNLGFKNKLGDANFTTLNPKFTSATKTNYWNSLFLFIVNTGRLDKIHREGYTSNNFKNHIHLF